MGQELECTMRLQRRVFPGRAYLESDHLLFRGAERLKLMFRDLTAVTAEKGILKLEYPGGAAAFELGSAAEKWAGKILHPPSRLDKLGVKAGMPVTLLGEFEPGFREELAAIGATVATDDIAGAPVFLAVQESAGLARVAKLARGLPPKGALWVVYPKGVAEIRETDVIAAGRGAGLKDIKVASFSSTHTALKFVK